MPNITVHVINGPNINLTGLRSNAHYGSLDYAGMCARIENAGSDLGLNVIIRQSNHEGELVDWLQDIVKNAAPVILNAGAYTHTSVALHDALEVVASPKIEVHMSNVHKREAFRHHSRLSAVVDGVIVGFGVESYIMALNWIASQNVKN